MPCYSPPMHRDEHGNLKNGEIPQSKFDQLVRMLCEANTIIDAIPHQKRQSRSTELAKWWTKHQEWDRTRKVVDETRKGRRNK
jgi:hypothetical protein